MKVYKVLRVEQFGLGRRFFSLMPSELSIEYHVGYPAHSYFGPLFAFSNINDVVRFASAENCAIFEAEAKIFPAKVTRVPFIGTNISDVYYFWLNVGRDGFVSSQYSNTVGVPFGTVFCEWLKPVREITKEEVQIMQLQILLKDGRNRLEFLQDEILKTSVEAEIASYKHSFNITAKQITSYLNDWLKENENNSI